MVRKIIFKKMNKNNLKKKEDKENKQKKKLRKKYIFSVSFVDEK